ncbi:aromatic amino acid transaminase [Novilysobacter antarcticus]|uniref:amino acid aminotransferase n=1 Tax=Novilysobacter antarcticus TaxID=2862543 RepID=UPI002484994E|nr:amino acid aminotransferase [Lysobacter antarcticus]
MDMFSHLPLYAGDPILSLQQAYLAETRADKVNLGIGAYQDANGAIPTLRSVAAVRPQIAADTGPSPYLPIAGAKAYRDAVTELVLGGDRYDKVGDRAVAIQSLGGSGALRVGCDMLKRYFPDSEVFISAPSWPNHQAIFETGGFKVGTYRYFDTATNGVDFDGMLADLQQMPARSIVILHPACHNPTGADLTRAQWDAVVKVVAERGLLPFLDMAYQGFAEGIDADAYAVHAMVDAGISLLLSVSFSKTFSLYGERVGALVAVCDDADVARRVLSQMEMSIRANYSSPPTFGGRIVTSVLTDPALRKDWRNEVEEMRTRMLQMRERLHAGMKARAPSLDVDYLVTQRGMFSYTGLNPAQVERLRTEHGIYAVGSGRICVAGLRDGNVDRVADAFAQVMDDPGSS